MQHAGLVAGLFGVGGGIVKVRNSLCTWLSCSALQHSRASQDHRHWSQGRRCLVQGPLMLEMGVLPDVAAATSATMMCASQLHLQSSLPLCLSLCCAAGPGQCVPTLQRSCLPNASHAPSLHNVQVQCPVCCLWCCPQLTLHPACSIFTAASASVVYLSFGGIPTDYAVLTFLVGLIFTIIGQVCSLLLLCNAPPL